MTTGSLIGDLLHDAAQRLAAVGIDTPRLDAELLMGAVVDHDRGWLWAHDDVTLSDDERAAFEGLVARRLSREPVAYLLGSKEFYSLDLRVDRRVLVPRPDTETLVEAVLEALPELPGGPDGCGADVGTGSGAVALALISQGARRVIATDLSGDALAVARANARRLRFDDRVRFVQGDGLSPLAGPLSWIASNPPYVRDDERDQVMAEVRHEPDLALYGGGDGLDALRRIVAEAPRCLLPGGLLALECDARQVPAVAELARAWGRVRVYRDLAGKERVVAVRRESS